MSQLKVRQPITCINRCYALVANPETGQCADCERETASIQASAQVERMIERVQMHKGRYDRGLITEGEFFVMMAVDLAKFKPAKVTTPQDVRMIEMTSEIESLRDQLANARSS